MKICNKCKIQKPYNEFYKDYRYENRLESHCKQCRNSQAINRTKLKYNPSISGSKKCKKCNKLFQLKNFPINRARKDGRKPLCKKCDNTFHALERRKRGSIFKSKNNVMDSNTYYKTQNCEVCESSYEMIRESHKRCKQCTKLVRNIHQRLGDRKSKKIKISTKNSRVALAVTIAKLFLNTNNCYYCKSKFTKNNFKQLEHINPINLGGQHLIDNIAICCKQCNRSKNRLNLNKWLFICNAVSKLDINHLQPLANDLLNHNKKFCKICGKDDLYHYLSLYCKSCSDIVLKLTSSLTSTRKGKYNKFSRNEIIKIVPRWIDSNSCIYCSREFSNSLHQSPDHIIPLSKGGKNIANNINICCFECNIAKSDLELDEWINLCKSISNNFNYSG